MNKAIKKEIERNLRQPTGKYTEIIKDYCAEVAGTEKALFVRLFFQKRRGYWETLKELNRHGFYLEQTTFYRIKDDVVTEIALRACYEGLICPYRDKTQQN